MNGLLSPVPNKALRFTPEAPLIGKNDIVKDCEGKHKLWTREGTTFTAHPVEVGISIRAARTACVAQTNLGNGSFEYIIRISIYREAGTLAFYDTAYISFIYIGHYLHLCQVPQPRLETETPPDS